MPNNELDDEVDPLTEEDDVVDAADEEDDEFEDDEEEDEDDDVEDGGDIEARAAFTQEIGSEGGSPAKTWRSSALAGTRPAAKRPRPCPAAAADARSSGVMRKMF